MHVVILANSAVYGIAGEVDHGTNVCAGCCSQSRFSAWLAEVAHMYAACFSARGPWPFWGYARALVYIADRSVMTHCPIRLWGRIFSVPCCSLLCELRDGRGAPRSRPRPCLYRAGRRSGCHVAGCSMRFGPVCSPAQWPPCCGAFGKLQRSTRRQSGMQAIGAGAS